MEEMSEELAKRMALAVNGGDWEADYTDAQKRGWLLKAEFCTTEANAQTALALERAKREGMELERAKREGMELAIKIAESQIEQEPEHSGDEAIKGTQGSDQLLMLYATEKRALRIERDHLETKLAKAVETLELADNNLTNLQPKIANGLVRSDWVPVFDGYIDPVINTTRTTLAEIKGEQHD